MEEIWKPAIKNNKTLPGYEVSNFGKVRGKKGNILKSYNDNPSSKGNGSFKGARQVVGLSVPVDLFDFSYKKRSENVKSVKITVSVHRLVMETHKPIDQNPPIPKNEWDVTPESAKKIIRDSCVVDHIDNNPFNNDISNLRWVTLLENQTFIKKHLSNKESIG